MQRRDIKDKIRYFIHNLERFSRHSQALSGPVEMLRGARLEDEADALEHLCEKDIAEAVELLKHMHTALEKSAHLKMATMDRWMNDKVIQALNGVKDTMQRMAHMTQNLAEKMAAPEIGTRQTECSYDSWISTEGGDYATDRVPNGELLERAKAFAVGLNNEFLEFKKEMEAVKIAPLAGAAR